MAVALKGEVALDFEGEKLTLVLDFNALCAFEGAVGENAQSRIALLEQGGGTFTDMRALLWAMLQAHHPKMTVLDAGRIIGEGMAEVSTAFKSAFTAAMPAADTTAKKPSAASKAKPAKALRGR
jgi:hypothetical protein